MTGNLLPPPQDTAPVRENKCLLNHVSFRFAQETQLHYNLMGSPLYMQSVVDQNIMWYVTNLVRFGKWCNYYHNHERTFPSRKFSSAPLQKVPSPYPLQLICFLSLDLCKIYRISDKCNQCILHLVSVTQHNTSEIPSCCVHPQ